MRSDARYQYQERLTEIATQARKAFNSGTSLAEANLLDLDRAIVRAIIDAQESDPSLWPDRAFVLRRHLDDENPEPAQYAHVIARRFKYPTEAPREWVHVGPYWMAESPGGYTRCEWEDLEVHANPAHPE